MSERRQNVRRRCLLGARAVFNARSSTMSCTVRNMSDHGAMLVFGETPYIPEQFELLLDNRRTLAPARVAWRHGDRVGIRVQTDLSKLEEPHAETGLLGIVTVTDTRVMH
jgi:PilZ domain